MSYKPLIDAINASYGHYEKGLEKLRKEAITKLQQKLEQSYTTKPNSQLPSTDMKSEQKVRTT